MTKSFFFQTLTLACFVFASFAAQAVPSKVAAFGVPTILRAGTSVFLTLNEELDATQISVGNAVEFIVRRDVTINGKVLIAANSPATGLIRKVESGCNGQCSKITFVVESVQATDGQTVLLNSIPHIVTAPCCDGTATALIGVNLTSAVRNDIRIK